MPQACQLIGGEGTNAEVEQAGKYQAAGDALISNFTADPEGKTNERGRITGSACRQHTKWACAVRPSCHAQAGSRFAHAILCFPSARASNDAEHLLQMGLKKA